MSHFEFKRVIVSKEEIEQLVELAKKGDGLAFEKLYKEFLTPVYRYVFLRTNSKEEAEDIVQVVFLKWYEALKRYHVETSPLQYLFVIAKHTLIDVSRKRGNQGIVSFDEDFYESVSDDTDFVHELDVRVTTEEVMRHMKTLSEREQEVITLLFLSERSTEEVAEILGLLDSNVRQIKKRALDKLRTSLSFLYDNT